MDSESGSLRDRALNAWHNRDEIAEKRDRTETAELLRYLLKERLGIDARPETRQIEIDGVLFATGRTRETGAPTLPVLHKCPDCGRYVGSADITDMSALGRVLEQTPALAVHRRTHLDLDQT